MSETALRTLRLHEAYAIAGALNAAENVGLLRALGGPARSANELAQLCEIEPRGAELLLRLLGHLGVVENENGRFRARPLEEALELWRGLGARLQSSAPEVACDTPAGAGRIYPNVVSQFAEMFREAIPRVAEQLAAPGLRVADFGAGAAPWSLALCAREPSIELTLVDFPAVLTTTRRAVSEAGVAAATYVAGDLFEVELPAESHDIVIVGLLCHLFGDERNRLLFERAHRTLGPGGSVAVIDIIPDPRGELPDEAMIAAYDLSLFLRTHEGQAHPFSSFARWLHEAGFGDVQRIALPGRFPPTLVRARKK